MGGDKYPIVYKTDNLMGRYLAASRCIEPGELILRDAPILVLPNAPAAKDEVTCVGCCGITQTSASLSCQKCGWPVCKEECGNNPDHSNFECKIFSKEKIQFPLSLPYCFVAEAEYIKVLRCVLLREFGKQDPAQLERWNLLMNFEAHVEQELRKTPKILKLNLLIRKFIQDVCKLTQFDDATIDFVLGAIDVNSFRNVIDPIFSHGKGTSTPSAQNKNASVLYPIASIVAHSCKVNTKKVSFANDGQLEMIAADFIPEQDVITHAYVDLMLGTSERRKLLKEQFYFDCTCARCSDPTEFGTYFSALKCQLCEKGYLLMDNPLDSCPYWKCNQCTEIQPTDYETELLDELRTEERKILKSGRKNNAMIQSWIDLLERFSNGFHENHYALLQIQLHLIRCMAKVSKPPAELVEDVQKMVQKYKKLYNTFYPNKVDVDSNSAPLPLTN